jgi:hypothetical protein
MSYATFSRDYSAAASRRLDSVVNKIYINGDVNINNGSINHGIQHSIAAERTGDVHVHSQSIDNRIQNNYVVNLDKRKVEFVSPYVGSIGCGEGKGRLGYAQRNNGYLLPGPSGNYDNSQEYQQSISAGLLKKCRPVTQFVHDSEEVKGLVLETFEKLTGQQFPDNIEVRVCGETEMKKAHTANGGKWNPGIMGFAINRYPYPSTIFVKKNHLDALMLTIGHELGHVLSPRLSDDVDEEAKAFAFELAWVKTVVEHDIGELAGNFNIDFVPAENGLHDRAFAFVQDVVKKGKESLKVFWELSKGILKAKTFKAQVI